jgi:hypothetical protein
VKLLVDTLVVQFLAASIIDTTRPSQRPTISSVRGERQQQGAITIRGAAFRDPFNSAQPRETRGDCDGTCVPRSRVSGPRGLVRHQFYLLDRFSKLSLKPQRRGGKRRYCAVFGVGSAPFKVRPVVASVSASDQARITH